ncbi:hypothetical protein BU14_0585s0009 [Porphyra umbilicalis]|uniref:PHD-type domain-containing protein n=1 Tax=Porphyra umbilicalis TaxID=2786 RepID=A0A1X6NRF7_PORUM|nr:hypothetical protein BU14_0585s0009 [Porphyra umbilicalis]|eukprot:OSX71162.1 hypothetical protein BU14_0585s0009 [Porphyra umbilicalis]
MTPSRRATGVGSLPGAVEAETVEVISLITPPASPAHDDVGTGSTPPPLFQPSVSPPPPPPAQNVAAAGSTPSHLVQPSIPPQSPLAAVAVARSPLLDIAPLRPIYLSPHSSDEDPTYDPSPASGRRRSVRGLRSGAADADPECNFCPGFSRTGGVMASELLGPFEARSKVGKGIMHLWVHEVCALWSPEVYLDPDTNAMLGVHKAYGRGRRLRCSECARIGPTVGCYVPSCRNVFHFLCIMAGRCHLVKDRHVILCERHKGEAASLEFKADMERIAAAAAAAVARKEAVAAACAGDPDAGKDTPHSQYTGLRRGETETIVSRAGGIAASPPDGKVVTGQGAHLAGVIDGAAAVSGSSAGIARLGAARGRLGEADAGGKDGQVDARDDLPLVGGSSAGSAGLGAARGRLLGAEAGGKDGQIDARDDVFLVDVLLAGGASKAAAALAESSAALASSAISKQTSSSTDNKATTLAAAGADTLPRASSVVVARVSVPPTACVVGQCGLKKIESVGTAAVTTAPDQPTVAEPPKHVPTASALTEGASNNDEAGLGFVGERVTEEVGARAIDEVLPHAPRSEPARALALSTAGNLHLVVDEDDALPGPTAVAAATVPATTAELPRDRAVKTVNARGAAAEPSPTSGSGGTSASPVPPLPVDGNVMQESGGGAQSGENDVRAPRLPASRVIEKSRMR